MTEKGPALLFPSTLASPNPNTTPFGDSDDDSDDEVDKARVRTGSSVAGKKQKEEVVRSPIAQMLYDRWLRGLRESREFFELSSIFRDLIETDFPLAFLSSWIVNLSLYHRHLYIYLVLVFSHLSISPPSLILPTLNARLFDDFYGPAFAFFFHTFRILTHYHRF